MVKRDAQPAPSGFDESKLNDLKTEITAQYAILDSAARLINQLHQTGMPKTDSDLPRPGWVYNMKDLEDWVHFYTERRRLHCPVCKQEADKDTEVRLVCTKCLTEYEFHDDL